MHGQLREKGHPLGNTFRRALVWEILSKRIPNREMCLESLPLKSLNTTYATLMKWQPV